MSNIENNTVYQNNENSSIFKLNVTANCHGSVPYRPIPQLAGIPVYCCFMRKTRPLSDILAERGCKHPYILVKRIVLSGAWIDKSHEMLERWSVSYSAWEISHISLCQTYDWIPQRPELFSNTKGTTFHSSSDEQIIIHHRWLSALVESHTLLTIYFILGQRLDTKSIYYTLV